MSIDVAATLRFEVLSMPSHRSHEWFHLLPYRIAFQDLVIAQSDNYEEMMEDWKQV